LVGFGEKATLLRWNAPVKTDQNIEFIIYFIDLFF
jgi:hypothetical protein